MAKNKVINTVLTVRDNMSGGLVKAAQNAKKKSGKAIDSSMISATRSVVAFKNKSVAALQDYAKKAGAAIVAGTTAVATGLSALTLKSALAADDPGIPLAKAERLFLLPIFRNGSMPLT